jgi:hypothetical protein
MRPETASATCILEVRLGSGMYPLARLLTTITGKRMPVENLTLARDGEGRALATLSLDCEEEAARRYAALLSGLEDVEEVGLAESSLEIALVRGESPPAEPAGVSVVACGEVAAACGEPDKLESWLGGARDVIRLGPMARPGGGA